MKDKDLSDLEDLTPLLLTILVDDNLLPDKLIHNVGKVGHDKDENHRHGQISRPYPCLGEEVSPVSDVRV